MKKLIGFSLVFIMASMITACDQTKSKDWYEAHPKETIEVHDKCMKSGDDSDNCRNAKWGYRLIQTKKQAGLPTGLE